LFQFFSLKKQDDVRALVDASVKFTSVLKSKGVSQATLSVAVRARPLSKKERLAGARTITKTVDERCMVVMDPDESQLKKKSKVVAGGVRKRERRYVFDGAFDGEASNEEVYDGTAKPLVRGVLSGVNATVFAYGATGSGKTHTMVGRADDPGLMILSLRDVFRGIEEEKKSNDSAFEVECSYTEVYNELVFDLLADSKHGSSSTPLELREDPTRGPVVAGLTHVSVAHESEIFALLEEGNKRRKTEETGANATSSRSHAVLEIWVTKREKNHYDAAFATAKLTLVDLAGAERASETNNRGAQLRDGANINKSLLSLANCINALGKRQKKGFVFVPFRDSKLTRILKDGLCGNSRTVMVATVSGSSAQYEHTVNTLKYADRAKEIKTFVQENRGTVETHIAEYQRVIDALREERRELKAEVERLKVKENVSSAEEEEEKNKNAPFTEKGGVKRQSFTEKERQSSTSRPSSGSSSKSDNPIADVNELLLAAAAALPEGDELRAEAEALAARARRAAAAGLGKPSPGARAFERESNLGPKPERFSGDVFDGLQYATRVLNETVRLNRERTKERESVTTNSSPRSDDTDALLSVSSVSSPGEGEGDVEATERKKTAALSPVPEREAANRANVARGTERGGAGKTAGLKKRVETARGSGSVSMPKKRPSAVVKSEPVCRKPVKKAVKPSPYAQSALGAAGAAGKPRSAALRRRLEKIRG
jgi:hypothetical protein